MSDIRINIINKMYRLAHDGMQFHHAIADLDLTVHPHQFVCLVGPSGCGKTTLLNMIAGLDPHFDGQIRMGNSEQSPSIGYVFQNPRLLPWRTVRENIELVLQGRDAAETVDFMLETMQLTRFQHG